MSRLTAVPAVPTRLRRSYRPSPDGSGWQHRCSHCEEWLPADDTQFQRDKRSSTGLGSLCLPCNRSIKRQWQSANTDVVYEQHARHRARHGRGPTDQQWNDMLDRFGHACVACGRHETEVGTLERARIDHSQPATANNVQPECRVCNARQGTRTEDYRPRYLSRLMRRAA